MNTFSNYINKYSIVDQFLSLKASPNLYQVIVIPALAEPDLLNTIYSIWTCSKPERPVEVIVVINSPENTDGEILRMNKQNEIELAKWAFEHNTESLKLHVLSISNIPKKHAGAGYARKIGMDEAVRRFISAGVTDGIINSLDADALVEKNYLTELEMLFKSDDKCNGCSIYFEHPVSGNQFDQAVYKTITDYELHLRYYKIALRYTGFPYFHHTVGSSFAVRALAYCKQGGMNKKQAGEDFYFLHKIMPLGHFYELNTTCIYPSSRPSNRVPFGTGATILEYAIKDKKEFLSFNFKAFEPLKILFSGKELFYKTNQEALKLIISQYDPLFLEFLVKNGFSSAMEEINANTGNLKSFTHRFFQWFDAFRIIKFLNFSHSLHYEKQPVAAAAIDCLMAVDKKSVKQTEPLSLLACLREREKQNKFGSLSG